MFKFIENIGDYFSGNYFTSDFKKNVIEKSGYSDEDLKSFESAVRGLKEKYFAFKKDYIDLTRCKDQIQRTNKFHNEVLKLLGYDAVNNDYNDLFHLDETQVIPVRQKLYRGDKPHLFIMEMKALIKTGEQEPKGLFEQNWNRAQWESVFEVQDGDTLTPSVINEAINELFLIDQHIRPTYILLLAGNEMYLLHFEKWFKGSYLRFKLEDLFDEATLHKDFYQLFYLLLSKSKLAPEADILLMDQLDEDSHKSAYAVTKDLKEGIIHAVELLANEALYYKKQILKEEFEESDDAFEQQMKDDCLTMVYRLLFVFYAESRPDLGILPMNDQVYEKGYSLDMLRELEQVQLNSESSRIGYFFHESLQSLFHLLNHGYRYKEVNNKSFTINRLDTPLFDDEKFHHLKGIKFRNGIWQDIICQLSLSQKQRGKARGRISYANLGINQLGSVYEGLLAYRGFYAEQDYIEVHEASKPNEGTFVVPRSRLDDFEDNEILKDEEGKVKILTKGTFVYRLSGRDRQQSASYYTPEVLTRTTVKYTLKPILERLDKKEIKADDLLDLKILEPAQGASAFQNEVVNQIADAYLDAKQIELKKKVPAKDYQDQLQRVKAFIATNNVYGVDINPTAIELGKLSLWLNVIHKDMEVPYFGYRLGVGNAVVGTWLKVYKKEDVIFKPRKQNDTVGEKKEWWEKAPEMRAFNKGKLARKEDEIYHFLLPDKNMAPSAGIKLLKAEYPAEAKRVTEWKTEFTKPIRGDEFIFLQKICDKLDELLEEHYNFQNLINQYTGEKKNFFGHEQPQGAMFTAYDEKDQLAQQRHKHNAPYFKLKMVMDYWCALWFWDVRLAIELPTRKQWYEDIKNILELDLDTVLTEEEDLFSPVAEQQTIFEEPKQARLKAYRSGKEKEVSLDSIKKYTNRADLFENKRLDIVKELSTKYKYFHNQLEFIEVFKQKGGFDVIVGNPPWISINFKDETFISDFYPEIIFRGAYTADINKFTLNLIKNENEKKNKYINELIIQESIKNHIGAPQLYSELSGQRNNLYKCVLVNTLNQINPNGNSGLVHPDVVFEDSEAAHLRKLLYNKIKYHFRFRNELKLFSEVGNYQSFSINIYCHHNDGIFSAIFNLFHPSTIDSTFIHDGKGEVGGLKLLTNGQQFNWNTKPHSKRLIKVSIDELRLFAKIANINEPYYAPLPTIHSIDIILTFQKLFSKNSVNFEWYFTDGFNETTAVAQQKIKRLTSYPNHSKNELIVSGPHFFVANPYYQTPKENCSSHRAYDSIDPKFIEDNWIPRTNYKPDTNFSDIDINFSVKKVSWLNSDKLFFSKMLNLTNTRTLQSSVFPSKSSHINSIVSLTFNKSEELISFAGLTSSIIYDFIIRNRGISNLYEDILKSMPNIQFGKLKFELFGRVLRLNCVSNIYKDLWEENYYDDYSKNSWSYGNTMLTPWSEIQKTYSKIIAPKSFYERRMLLLELDVIIAIAAGLELSELLQIYEVQFAVEQQNEQETYYDQDGNIIFTNNKSLSSIGIDRIDWERVKNNKEGDDITHTISKSELYKGKQITYYPPFNKCDRVEDYKRSWVHFEERFKEK